MSDEEEFDATAAMADDEGDSGAADEPAISAEALQDMPDAPERWDDKGEIVEPGPRATGEQRGRTAADAAAETQRGPGLDEA